MSAELLDRLQSTLGSTLTLERELGGGGMSRVFVATETALGRRVVVKTLPEELAAGVSIERFKREIMLAASLLHPHVVPLLSAGEVDGLPYYTMPFVEGESLRARLARAPRLPVDEAVQLTREIASALDYAHRRGIVHRDIKPENVLLHDGHALVTDFGIARAVSQSATAPALTAMGVAVGTPAYMSPEQCAGESELDGRSDVYALGAVLYEMLAGEPPFAGATARAIITRHFTDAPPRVRARRDEVPAGVEDAIARAMAKAPDERFATAASMSRALDEAMRAPTPGSVPIAARTQVTPPGTAARERAAAIAVLPFDNLSPDPADGWFADGLTDELITDLAAIRTLRVTARNSVMRLKGTEKQHRTIAGELGVRYLVTGSVRRAGDGIRVTVALHDTTDDVVLWTDKITGPMGDVFEIQERIAGRITEALRLTLSPDERRRMAEHPVTDLRAYEYLLQARHALWTFTVPSLDRARMLLENALAIVGDNALLLAALGQVHMNYLDAGQASGESHRARAEEYARRAEALAPEAPATLALRGWIHFKRGEIREAIHALERAHALEPSNADHLMLLSYACLLAGRDDRARSAADESVALDPLTPLIQCMPGFCEQLRGQPAAAVPHYRKFHAMDPANPAAHYFLVMLLAHAGQQDEALALGEAGRRDFAGTSFGALCGGYVDALQGNTDAARAAVTPELRSAAQGSEMHARFISELMVLAGDREAAIDALEQVVRLGMTHWPFLARHNRLYATLHGHPRFERLMTVVRERWERGGASAQDYAA